MDLVRPEFLRQITLRLSVDRNRPVYLAQDRSNGKIYVLARDVALNLRRMAAAALGTDTEARQIARSSMDEEGAKQAFGALQVIQTARLHEQTVRKPFNPIFANFPLFDVGPWQHRLAPVARRIVGPVFWITLATLMVMAIVLGTRNDWQILDAFKNIFSLQALITFGLIAPVLKLVHELGHVMAATSAGVRVRKAGVFVIGLYPMPFVDCTEADMSARRTDRIAISGAGILTDILIGLLAFVVWHFVEGNYLRTLLANVFVFSTLNSVLFNANPLIKLDGYYVMTDVIGQRNLATRASAAIKALRLWIASFGARGARPRGSSWLLVVYGLAAMLYRINVMIVIASSLLPRYLGVGAAVTVWGGLLMTLGPIMRDRPAAPTSQAGGPKTVLHRLMWWGGLGGLVIAALFFIRMPVIVAVPVALDVADSYQITARSAGVLTQVATDGPVQAGAALTVAANQSMSDEFAALQAELGIAEAIFATVRGVDPARAQAAREQILSARERLTILAQDLEGLATRAMGEGFFSATSRLNMGNWVAAGTVIGTLYPAEGATMLRGDFPENRLSAWDSQLTEAVLRIGNSDYVALDPSALDLREIMDFDRESGARNWTLFVTHAAQTPAAMAGSVGLLRLRFEPVPLVDHIGFWWDRMVVSYRESQLADRANYLN